MLVKWGERMNKNIIAGGSSFIISLIYTLLAFQIPMSSYKSADIQPGTFPIIIGCLWMLVSLVLLIQGILASRRRKEDTGKPLESTIISDMEESEQDGKKLLIILLFILAYIVLFVSLGYLLSTALFIFGVTTYLERKKWVRNLIYAILFPVIVYLVFNDLLEVYLPSGPF